MARPPETSTKLPPSTVLGSAVVIAGRMLPHGLAMTAVLLWYVPWLPDVPRIELDHAIVAAWIGRAQPLHALDDYLLNSAEMARGYAEAMAWPTL